MAKPPANRRVPQPPPGFRIKTWGFDISAQGSSGICAAFLLVIFIVAAWRWF